MFLPNLDGDFVDVSGCREDGCGGSGRGRRTAAGLLTLGGWCSGCTGRPRTVSGFFGSHGSIAGLPVVTFLRPSIIFAPHTMSSSSSSTAPPAKRQKNSGRRSYFLRSSVAPIFSTTRCINIVPVEVWREIICRKFLNLTELSILRRCHTFFEKYWQNVMAQNLIRVPQGCPTVEKAMALAVIFSERKE